MNSTAVGWEAVRLNTERRWERKQNCATSQEGRTSRRRAWEVSLEDSPAHPSSLEPTDKAGPRRRDQLCLEEGFFFVWRKVSARLAKPLS